MRLKIIYSILTCLMLSIVLMSCSDNVAYDSKRVETLISPNTTAIENKPTEEPASVGSEIHSVDSLDTDDTSFSSPSSKVIMANQSHIGTWLSENSTYWVNVISVENDQITVNFGSARAFGLEAVAVERDGKYYFSKELSPYFHWSPYSTVFRSYEELINGYIEFSEDFFRVTAEKLFLGTEGDVVTIKFLKQVEDTDISSSNVESVESPQKRSNSR